MYQDHALSLYDMGHQTAPVQGKRLFLNNWTLIGEQKQPRSMIEKIVSTQYGTTNTGTAYVFGNANPLCAVDCDVLDTQKSRQIFKIARSVLGDSPLVRLGKVPKFAIFYRKSGAIENSRIGNLEVFGSTGAALNIYGEHPDTREPYRWPYKDLLAVKPEEVPAVTAPQIEEFINKSAPFLSFRTGTLQGSRSSRFSSERKGKSGFDFGKVIQRQLAEMEPGNRHEILISVVAALVNRGMSDSEILKIFWKPYIERFHGDRTNREKKVFAAIKSARRNCGKRGLRNGAIQR
jgi:hypothetical protein